MQRHVISVAYICLTDGLDRPIFGQPHPRDLSFHDEYTKLFSWLYSERWGRDSDI